MFLHYLVNMLGLLFWTGVTRIDHQDHLKALTVQMIFCLHQWNILWMVSIPYIFDCFISMQICCCINICSVSLCWRYISLLLCYSAEDRLLQGSILEVNSKQLQFKLAPTYTLYMAVRNLLSARSPVTHRSQLVADFANKTARMTQQSIQVWIHCVRALQFYKLQFFYFLKTLMLSSLYFLISL